MTIHNAKGMQSPIVFLADTTTIPKSDLQLIFDAENTSFWCRNDTNHFCEKLKAQQKISEAFIKCTLYNLATFQVNN